MAGLRDFLTEHIEEDGYQGYIDELDQMEARYNELQSSSTARFDELSTQTAAMKEQIANLKARNYDLLMQVPANGGPQTPTENDVLDTGDVVHIESLFSPIQQGGK